MKNLVFVNPSYLRVWAGWCKVHGVKEELQNALLDAAAEIERLQFKLGLLPINGNGRAETNNEVSL